MKLDHSLVDWVESVMGGHVVSAQRTFGGGSRITWLVDLDLAVEAGFETVPLVLRVESGQGPFHGTPVTLQREAVVYAALQESPARVPTLYLSLIQI